jgi:D-amino peptidase
MSACRIYILADMEGISGIRLHEQVNRSRPEYAEGCRLMRAEMNVAIAAAYAGGATEVVACDTHGMGGQVAVAEMDERAVYEMPVSGDMMPALDSSFAGVVLLGHHARAGTLNGFLDHTMSSEAWFECTLNGQAVGEIGLEAAFALLGVPIIAVTGDQACCDEARALLGGIETAVVKWGIGRNRARCLSLPQAHARVHNAIARAVQHAKKLKAFAPQRPLTLRLTFYRTDMADEAAVRPGITRIDARTVECVTDSMRGLRLF